MAKNYLGQELFNTPYELENDSYGTGEVSEYGPVIAWSKYMATNPNAIEGGFDKRFPYQRITLPIGTCIMRYGHPAGYFTAPTGTPYEMLSLPYKKETVAYHEYVVIKPVNVNCVVTKGIVASCFGQIGGGIQYMHEESIENLLGICLLEDESWLKKLLKS